MLTIETYSDVVPVKNPGVITEHVKMALANVYSPGMEPNGGMLECHSPKIVPNKKARDLAREYTPGDPRRWQLEDTEILVRCRKCEGCEAQKSYIKTSRHVTEALAWGQYAHLVTLTINDTEMARCMTEAKAPTTLTPEEYKSLRRKGYKDIDLQYLRNYGWPSVPSLQLAHIEQLRKDIDRTLMRKYGKEKYPYWAMSVKREYGSREGRGSRDMNPHWHLMMYGLSYDDMTMLFGKHCHLIGDEVVRAYRTDYDSGIWARKEKREGAKGKNQYTVHKVSRGAVHVISVRDPETGDIREAVAKYAGGYIAKADRDSLTYGALPEKLTWPTGKRKKGVLRPGISPTVRGPLGSPAIPIVIHQVEQHIKIERKKAQHEERQLSVAEVWNIVRLFHHGYKASNEKNAPIVPIGLWERKKVIDHFRKTLEYYGHGESIESIDEAIYRHKARLEDRAVKKIRSDSGERERRNELRLKSGKRLFDNTLAYKRRKRDRRMARKGPRQYAAM